MATVGALNVKLALSTAAFSKGVGVAVKGLGAVAAGAAAAAAAVAGAGLAVAGAALAVAKFVDSQADAVVQTTRVADQLGVNTSRLIELQHAGAQVAITAEEVNSGLAALNKTLGRVEAGSGFARASLEALGLDAAAVAALPLDKSFVKIADAFQRIEDPLTRANLAFQIFGDQAKTIFPVLSQGPAGLAANAEQARKLGIAIDRLDAQRLLDAQTQFANLKSVLTGVARQLAVAVAPAVTLVSKKLTEFFTQGPGLAGLLVKGIDAVVAAIPAIADALEPVIRTLIDFGRAFLGVLAEISGRLAEGAMLSGRFELSDQLFKMALAASNAETRLRMLGKAIDVRGAGAVTAEALDRARQIIADMAEEGKNLQDAFGALPKVDRFAEAFGKLPGIFEATRTPLERMAEKLAEIRFLMGTAVGQTFGDALRRSAAGAVRELESSLGLAGVRLPRALQGGTQEAATAIVQFQQAELRRREDPAELVARLTQAALTVQREQARYQKAIADAVLKLDVQVAGAD